MRKTARNVLLVLGLLGLLGLVVLIYDAMGEIRWVGGTELTIEFVVTDAQTGQPIPGAEIHLEAESGGYIEGKNPSLTLMTETEGRVSRVIPNCTCIGSQSNLRLRRDTRAVYIPPWQVGCRAPGYQANEPFWLLELPHRRNVRQVGPTKDLLVVPIALRKAAS